MPVTGAERVSNYRKRQKAELEALRAEVAGLRAEVALLRSQQAAHVCPSWPQPQGGGLWPPQTGWPIYWQSPANVCAGAAPVPSLLTFNVPV